MAKGRTSKIVRIIGEYDLTGLGDQLEKRWTHPNPDERDSLRQLAHVVNLEILDSVLDTINTQQLGREVENLYHLLTADDVSTRAHTQARAELEQHDIDVNQLLQDFVSRQAVYTYLTNHREVSHPETEPSGDEVRSDRLESIQRLRSRLETMTRSVLTKLRNAGHLTIGEFSVVVTVRVHCTDCSAQIPITRLLKSGHCDCDSTTA